MIYTPLAIDNPKPGIECFTAYQEQWYIDNDSPLRYWAGVKNQCDDITHCIDVRTLSSFKGLEFASTAEVVPKTLSAAVESWELAEHTDLSKFGSSKGIATLITDIGCELILAELLSQYYHVTDLRLTDQQRLALIEARDSFIGCNAEPIR